MSFAYTSGAVIEGHIERMRPAENAALCLTVPDRV